MALNVIDVSDHQSKADVGKLAADAVICKVSQGNWFINSVCDRHFQQALKAGKKLGVYHFIEAGDGVAQADFFLRNISGYIGKALLAADFEKYIDHNTKKECQATVATAKAFLDRVYEKTGIRPLIYIGLSDINTGYNWESVVKANYGLWLAQYNNYNKVYGFAPRDLYGHLTQWPNAAMFQYTSTGRLPGYDGDLDFSIFYGDKAAWDAYAKAGKSVATPTKAPTKSAAKPVVAKTATTAKSWKDSIGDTWYAEIGKFRTNQNINLRYGAKTSSTLIALLNKGTVIKYDAYSPHDGYMWLRQPREGGKYGYLAIGEYSNGKRVTTWGDFPK